MDSPGRDPRRSRTAKRRRLDSQQAFLSTGEDGGDSIHLLEEVERLEDAVHHQSHGHDDAGEAMDVSMHGIDFGQSPDPVGSLTMSASPPSTRAYRLQSQHSRLIAEHEASAAAAAASSTSTTAAASSSSVFASPQPLLIPLRSFSSHHNMSHGGGSGSGVGGGAASTPGRSFGFGGGPPGSASRRRRSGSVHPQQSYYQLHSPFPQNDRLLSPQHTGSIARLRSQHSYSSMMASGDGPAAASAASGGDAMNRETLINPNSPMLAPVRTGGHIGALFDADEDHLPSHQPSHENNMHNSRSAQANQFPPQMEFELDREQNSSEQQPSMDQQQQPQQQSSYHSSHLSLAIPADDEARDIMHPVDYQAASDEQGTLFEGLFNSHGQSAEHHSSALPTPSHAAGSMMFTPLSSPARSNASSHAHPLQQPLHSTTHAASSSSSFLFPPTFTPRFGRDASQTAGSHQQQEHDEAMSGLNVIIPPSPARFMDPSAFAGLPILPSPGMRMLQTPAHVDMHRVPLHSSRASAFSQAHLQQLHSPAIHSSRHLTPSNAGTPQQSAFSFSFSPMTTPSASIAASQQQRGKRKRGGQSGLALDIPSTPLGSSNRPMLSVLASPAPRFGHHLHPSAMHSSASQSGGAGSSVFLPEFFPPTPQHGGGSMHQDAHQHLYDDDAHRIVEEDAQALGLQTNLSTPHPAQAVHLRQPVHLATQARSIPSSLAGVPPRRSVSAAKASGKPPRAPPAPPKRTHALDAATLTDLISLPPPPKEAVVVALAEQEASFRVEVALDHTATAKGKPAAFMEPGAMASNPFAKLPPHGAPKTAQQKPPPAAAKKSSSRPPVPVSTTSAATPVPPMSAASSAPIPAAPGEPLGLLSTAATVSAAGPVRATSVVNVGIPSPATAAASTAAAKPAATVMSAMTVPTPSLAAAVPVASLSQSPPAPGVSTNSNMASASAVVAAASKATASGTLAGAAAAAAATNAPPTAPVPAPSPSVHAALSVANQSAATPALSQASNSVAFIPQARTVLSTARETIPATVVEGGREVLKASTVVAAAAPTVVANTAALPTPTSTAQAAVPSTGTGTTVATPAVVSVAAGIVRTTSEAIPAQIPSAAASTSVPMLAITTGSTTPALQARSIPSGHTVALLPTTGPTLNAIVADVVPTEALVPMDTETSERADSSEAMDIAAPITARVVEPEQEASEEVEVEAAGVVGTVVAGSRPQQQQQQQQQRDVPIYAPSVDPSPAFTAGALSSLLPSFLLQHSMLDAFQLHLASLQQAQLEELMWMAPVRGIPRNEPNREGVKVRGEKRGKDGAAAAADATASQPPVDPDLTSSVSILLLPLVRIADRECQEMVVEGVNLLEEIAPETKYKPLAADDAGRPSTRSSPPAAEIVESEEFASRRKALLARMEQAHPLELDCLLYRLAQHSLYIHSFGWQQYRRGFKRPPPIAAITQSLAACAPHTQQRQAEVQAKQQRVDQRVQAHLQMMHQSAMYAAPPSLAVDPAPAAAASSHSADEAEAAVEQFRASTSPVATSPLIRVS